MHTSRTLPRPSVKPMRGEEDECALLLPPLLVLRRFSLLFIKTLKFLEQLRTIISRHGEIATEERSNLCRQHFSTTRKTDQGDPLVTREKFLPVSGERGGERREKEREDRKIWTYTYTLRFFLIGSWNFILFSSISLSRYSLILR